MDNTALHTFLLYVYLVCPQHKAATNFALKATALLHCAV